MDIDSILSDSHRKRAQLRKRLAEARRKKPRLEYHLRRVACEIRIAGAGLGATSVHDGFVVGPDLMYSRIHLFTRRSFYEGQNVEVTVNLGARPQYLTGYVRTVRAISQLGSRLFRIEVLLDSPAGPRERASFMEFLNEFHRRTMWAERF